MDTDGHALRQRLRRLFLDELDDHVGRLENGLEQLRLTLPTVPREVVQQLFRSAHSLKGAAHATGATSVASSCHELEELLAGIRDGTQRVDSRVLDLLVAATDAVAEAGRGMRSAEDTDRVEPPTDRPAVPADSAARRSLSGEATLATAGQPVPQTAPPEPAALRVPADKLDALLDQAGELLSATYRMERLTAAMSAAGARLAEEQHEWARDGPVVEQALGPAAADRPVAEAMTRMQTRARGAATELDRLARSAASSERGLRTLAESFAEAARDVRSVPFTDTTAGLAAVVRQLSHEAGKESHLLVAAAAVDIDKRLVAPLHDALRHLVRNAVDHGLELPEERIRAGKPPTGVIEITAALCSDGIEVAVSDDGRGVDFQAVRAATRAVGTTAAEGDDRTVIEALFRPGLTTAGSVTEVSGRGVGLDAVRASVESLGGTVSLTSVAGAGTRVVVGVPLTLSTLHTVLVRSAGTVVALPSSAVHSLVRISRADTTRVHGRDIVELHERPVPVVRLADALGWEEATAGDQPARAATADDREADEPALVVTTAEGLVVLTVDELLEERSVLMRASTPRLVGAPALLGTTLLEDGAVALVLNAAACARLGLERSAVPGPPERPQRRTRQPVVLLAEDTLTTRELERSILESAGYSVLLAGDGAQAWQLLQDHAVDAVVSDVNMPRMDGVALCRAIRSSTRLADVPVVLVTSLAGDDDRRRGLDAGADAYLPKPQFGRDELLDTLRRVL